MRRAWRGVPCEAMRDGMLRAAGTRCQANLRNRTEKAFTCHVIRWLSCGVICSVCGGVCRNVEARWLRFGGNFGAMVEFRRKLLFTCVNQQSGTRDNGRWPPGK